MTGRALSAVDQVKQVLAAGLVERFRRDYDTQNEAARKIGIDEASVSRLCSGRIDRFSIPYLLRLCGEVGAKVSIEVE